MPTKQETPREDTMSSSGEHINKSFIPQGQNQRSGTPPAFNLSAPNLRKSGCLSQPSMRNASPPPQPKFASFRKTNSPVPMTADELPVLGKTSLNHTRGASHATPSLVSTKSPPLRENSAVMPVPTIEIKPFVYHERDDYFSEKTKEKVTLKFSSDPAKDNKEIQDCLDKYFSQRQPLSPVIYEGIPDPDRNNCTVRITPVTDFFREFQNLSGKFVVSFDAVRQIHNEIMQDFTFKFGTEMRQ